MWGTKNSIRLNQIELLNFRRYVRLDKENKQRNEIKFPEDEKKNIFIISGENGTGKTTILEAILWSLYGYIPEQNKILREPTNTDSWKNIHGTEKGKGSYTGIPTDNQGYMSVRLWFAEKTDYNKKKNHMILRRTVPKYKSSTPKTASQITVSTETKTDGETYPVDETFIESILPQALVQFFKIDGEEIKKWEVVDPEKTAQAIQLILRLETFRRGSDHIKKLKKQIDNDIKNELGKLGVAQDDIDNRDNIEKQMETCKEKSIENWKEKTKLEREITEIENQLTKFKNEKEKIEELKRKKDELNKNENNINRIKEQISESIKWLPAKIILPELNKCVEKEKKFYGELDNKKTEKENNETELKLISKFEKELECLCGNKITKKETEYFKKQKKKLNTKKDDLKKEIERLESDPRYEDIKETKDSISKIKIDVKYHEDDLDEATIDNLELKSKIDDLDFDIGSSEQKEITDLGEKRKEKQEQRDALITANGKLSERYEEHSKNYKIAKGRVENHPKYIEASNKYKKEAKITESLLNLFNEILTKLTEIRKTNVAKNSTEIFREITNNPQEDDSLEIDENYNIYVKGIDGELTGHDKLSLGQKQIVVLSFMIGLMQASERPLPLLCDTFFSHLDKNHLSKVINALPKFSHQILLFLIDTELDHFKKYATEETWGHVNKIFEVKRHPNKNIKRSTIEEISQTEFRK